MSAGDRDGMAGYKLYVDTSTEGSAPLIPEPKITPHSDRDQTPLRGPVGDGGELGESFSQADSQLLLAALEKAVLLLRGQVQDEQSEAAWRRPLIPLWLTKYLLLITIIIQAFAVGMLEIFYVIRGLNNTETSNMSNFAKSIVYTGDAVMIFIESVQLLVIFAISFKLVKQVFHHTVSGSFLAQSYLSTVLLFAGLYTLFFRFDSDGWENVITHGNESLHPFIVFLRLLYFSVSTATLCGTSSVEPLVWYCYLTVGVQMLLSFCYFASILSLTIVPRKQSKFAPRSKPLSYTHRLRNCFSRHWTRYQ